MENKNITLNASSVESDRIMIERKKLLMDIAKISTLVLGGKDELGEREPSLDLLRLLAQKCALLKLADMEENERKILIQSGQLSLGDLYKSGLEKAALSEEEKKELGLRFNSIKSEDIKFPSNLVEVLKIDPLLETDPIQKYDESLDNLIFDHPKPEVKEAAGFMSFFNY